MAQSESLGELALVNCNMDDMGVSTLCDVLTRFPNCKLHSLRLNGNLRIPEVGKSPCGARA